MVEARLSGYCTPVTSLIPHLFLYSCWYAWVNSCLEHVLLSDSLVNKSSILRMGCHLKSPNCLTYVDFTTVTMYAIYNYICNACWKVTYSFNPCENRP